MALQQKLSLVFILMEGQNGYNTIDSVMALINDQTFTAKVESY